MDDDIFPIQIREDLVVRFAHIPNDLTQGEADKICRVIQALVKDDSRPLAQGGSHD